MESISDQPVEDPMFHGKRKRSPGSSPHTPQDQSFPAIEDQISDVPTKVIGLTSAKKRRREDVSLTESSSSGARLLEHEARDLLSPLPIEVLQHIMSFLDPFCLGRVMCVNKYLCGLLDPHQGPIKSSGLRTRLPFFSVDSLWSSSRRTHLHGMPHPLNSTTELDMFRLTYGKRCQICKTLPRALSSRLSATPWNSGPGPTGIRAIWPFKIKACAKCLKLLLIKEADLLQPGGHHQLQRGLLSASFTPSLHYVMSLTLAHTPIPPNLQLTAYYYRPHVEELVRDAPMINEPGSAAFESWYQHLDALRQEAVADSVRLEAWELSQKVVNDMLTVPLNVTSRSSASGSSVHSDNFSKSYFTTSSGAYRPPVKLSTHSGVGSSKMSGSLLRKEIGVQAFPRNLDSDMETGTVYSHPGFSSLSMAQPDGSIEQPRPPPDRNSLDIVRLKGEKRKELQRKCSELVPPIPPATLDKLPAFQSALQILMPLDENSWEKLKFELQSQRYSLEISRGNDQENIWSSDLMDTDTICRPLTPLHEPVEDDPMQGAHRPVREKLEDFANEHIRRLYAGGTNLTYSSAPQFAADVLLYVRERFYQNQKSEDAAFAAVGQQPPDEGRSGIRTRRLRLEHMKYVFDTCIKRFTELVRKDLFLCNECDMQGKHFALEGIIQHYASRHTSNFSRGNAVVYWKSEWPAQPPFDPAPGRSLDSVAHLSHPPSISQTLIPPGSTSLPTNMTLTGNSRGQETGVSEAHAFQGFSSHGRYTIRDESVHEAPRNEHSTTFAVPIEESGTARIYDKDMSNSKPSTPIERPYRQAVDSYTTSSGKSESAPYSQTRDHHGLYLPFRTLEEQQQMRSTTTAPESDPRREIQYKNKGVEASLRHSSHYPTLSQAMHVPHDERQHTIYLDPPSLYQFSTAMYSGNEHGRVVQPRAFVQTGAQGQDGSARNSRMHDPVFDRAPAITSNASRSAAERFLESFDVNTNHDQYKDERYMSYAPSSRPPSSMDAERRETIHDRKSNISQRRSRTQDSSDHDTEMPAVDAIRLRVHDVNEQTPFYSTSTNRGQQYQTLRPNVADHSASYLREPVLNSQLHPRVRFYGEPDWHPEHSETREHRYYPERPRFFDQYGMEVDPPSPELRRYDPPRHQVPGDTREVRVLQPYYLDGSPFAENRFERRQYVQHAVVRDPQSGRYYEERLPRETISNPQYTGYEVMPPREIIYEDDFRNPHYGPAGPPTDDQRHDRR